MNPRCHEVCLKTSHAPESRIKVTDDEFGGFRITIDSTWKGSKLGCLVLGTFLWLLTGCVYVCGFASDQAGPRSLYTALTIWIVLGIVLVGGAIVIGAEDHEVIMVSDQHFTVRRETRLKHFDTTFALREVRNLRFADSESWRGIEFQVGERKYHVGSGLSKNECLRVIKTLKTRFKFPDDLDEAEPLPIEND